MLRVVYRPSGRTLLPPVTVRRPRLRIRRVLRRAEKKPEQKEEVIGTSKDLFDGGLFERGLDPRLFGDDVDPDTPLPPEFEKDFWEDPKFEVIGKLMQNFIPVIVVLGLVAGGIAAKSFNDGATSYLKPASSETTSAEIVPLQTEKKE